MEKTSLNLGFQHFTSTDLINGSDSTTVAKFVVYRRNLLLKAAPKDPKQCAMFCQLLGGKHTAKLKEDRSTVTIRFEMCGIIKLVKAEDGSEVLTMAPVEGSEELFKASQLISIKNGGKMVRQIAFECDTEFLNKTDSVEYFDFIPISDR